MKSVNGNGVSIGSSIGKAYVYINNVDLDTNGKIIFQEAVTKLISKFESQIKTFKDNDRI